MKSSLLLLAFLAGCANEAVRNDPPPAGGCPLPLLSWPAAADTWDHSRTSEAALKVAQAARADAARFQSEPAHLGSQLAEIDSQVSRTTFLEPSVVELATRLRQLDCAVMRGTFARHPEQAEKLYLEIATSLESEHAKLASAR